MLVEPATDPAGGEPLFDAVLEGCRGVLAKDFFVAELIEGMHPKALRGRPVRPLWPLPLLLRQWPLVSSGAIPTGGGTGMRAGAAFVGGSTTLL